MQTEIKSGDIFKTTDCSADLFVCLNTDSASSKIYAVQIYSQLPSSTDCGTQIKGYISESLQDFYADTNNRSSSLKSNAIKIGQLEEQSHEVLLRAAVKSDVNIYYTEVHKKQHKSEYSAGQRVPYAGRVFDQEEMLNLTDASLDFWLTAGRFSKEFEIKFAKLLNVRYSYLVNSGSSANLLAFSALTSSALGEDQVKAGDEVITVAAGFPTTVSPIIQNGCIPVFLDILVDDGTYNIDTSLLEEAVSPKTSAVMLAHTLGNPFNLKVIKEFCDKHNLWLIEDNCDALGSKYDGKLTGTFGDVATSSFYPPHHLTMGEGGAVYSSNVKLKKIIESFRDWGRDCWCEPGCDNTCGKRFSEKRGDLPFGYDHKYVYRHFGYNLKATDLQAAIGLAQLKKLDDFTDKRRSNWLKLKEGLKDLEEFFILPSPTPNSEPSWFGFPICLKDNLKFSRSEIVSHLESNNIQTRMLFAGNLLRQPCFDQLRSQQGEKYRVVGDLNGSDRIMNDLFWIGVYPGLKQGMLEHIIDTIHKFVKQ